MADDAGVALHRGWRPGLIGEIAAAHARYYAREWGFGGFFEAKVARECAAFFDRAGAEDLALSAWRGEAFHGSLIVDAHDPAARPAEAHLRWFIVAEPGRGLGGLMMKEAVGFLDRRGQSCFLTTFEGLDPARRLYERCGFGLVSAATSETWGVTVAEQRFERAADHRRPVG